MKCPQHKLLDPDCDLCREEKEGQGTGRGLKRSKCKVRGCDNPSRGTHGFCRTCHNAFQRGTVLVYKTMNSTKNSHGVGYDYPVTIMLEQNMRDMLWDLTKQFSVSLSIIGRTAFRRYLKVKFINVTAKEWLCNKEGEDALQKLRRESGADQQDSP